jgi:hypothetical protein
MGKTDRKKLDESILKLWSACAKTAQRKCQVQGCNSEYKLSAHHVAPRQYRRTRYLLRNGLCLCAGHHMLQKIDPEKFRNMIIEIIGEEEYDRLHQMAWNNGEPFKHTIDDLKELKAELQANLKSLEADWGTI